MWSSLRKSDGWMALMVFALVLIGILMIYSSSIILGHTRYGDDQFFVRKQLISAALGFVFLIITSQIDYHVWQKWASAMLGVTFVLLISVFFFSTGEINGAHRWITIAGQTFQPSEFTKLTFIIYFSAWFAQRKEKIDSITETFIPYLVVLGAVSVLMLMQPDFGTLTIILLPVLVIYYVAGMGWRHVALGLVIGVVSVGLILAAAPYRLKRVQTFLNPTEDTSGRDYHINNIAIAIGSGGPWGLGFGQSRQKRLFLPEPHTDSIFAVITEELGSIRSFLIVVLLVGFIGRGYRLALHAKDDFGRYLAVGITTWFGFQSFLNLASMLHLVPLVGVPLPFISYGGTSLMICLAAVGVLLSISRQAEYPNHTSSAKKATRGKRR